MGCPCEGLVVDSVKWEDAFITDRCAAIFNRAFAVDDFPLSGVLELRYGIQASCRVIDRVTGGVMGVTYTTGSAEDIACRQSLQSIFDNDGASCAIPMIP